jgi:hypothetical protein
MLLLLRKYLNCWVKAILKLDKKAIGRKSQFSKRPISVNFGRIKIHFLFVDGVLDFLVGAQGKGKYDSKWPKQARPD